MMNLVLVANICMIAGAFLGMTLIAHKNRWGFVAFLLTEASYIYLGFVTANYGFVIIAIFYVIMNWYSWITWGKLGADHGRLVE